MSRTHRLAAIMTTVAALIAILALPGAATAKARDRNHDRIPDRWEKRHHLSLRVNQARRDQDHDHLRNRAEFLAGTDPRDADSDDDGIRDGEEHAGKISSFDSETGVLTIGLFGGGSVSGLVTETTEIECDDESAEASASEDSGDGEGEEGESEDGGGDNAECGTADLVPGAVVDEAELELANGLAVYEKVELGG